MGLPGHWFQIDGSDLRRWHLRQPLSASGDVEHTSAQVLLLYGRLEGDARSDQCFDLGFAVAKLLEHAPGVLPRGRGRAAGGRGGVREVEAAAEHVDRAQGRIAFAANGPTPLAQFGIVEDAL